MQYDYYNYMISDKQLYVMMKHYHKQRKKPPNTAKNYQNITSNPQVKITRLLHLIALISITVLASFDDLGQQSQGLFGMSLGVQGASISTDTSQLNRMTNSAATNQKAMSKAVSGNKNTLKQGSKAKMVTTTETQEQAKTNSLSQETIDAAAQMTNDEASAELTKALGQSTGTTRNKGTQQERNLLVGLDSVEEGSLEGALEVSENMSQEQEKTKSAVDATLEEIQRLHIIEQELAKAQVGTAEKTTQKSKEINQNKIVSDTLAKIKSEQSSKVPKKDSMRVEQLVQQQIEEQTTAIEDSTTMEANADVLNYGNYIDNKEFTSTGEMEDQQLQEDLKEIEKEDAEKEKQDKDFKQKQAQAAKDASEIDDTNAQHIQSEAALGNISPKMVKSTTDKKVSREPLMPSKDASKLDLSGDLPFTSKKEKQKPKSQKQQLAEQKKKIAEVVKKSIALQKETTKLESKDKKKIEAAEALFNFKQQQVTKSAPVSPKKDPIKSDVKDSGKSKDASNKENDKSKPEKKEEKVEEKKALAKKTKKKRSSKKAKSAASSDDKDHEILQLDNLFLTVRESLVTESTKKSKTHKKSKKKHAKKKQKKSTKKGKAPKSSNLLQLESDISASSLQGQRSRQKSHLRNHLRNKAKVASRQRMFSLHQLRQASSVSPEDLSMDDNADLELQALAKSEIKMVTAAKEATKSETDESSSTGSSGSTTIEVKDVSDSEVEGSTSLDKTQTQRDAEQALKKQQSLENIADKRYDTTSDNVTIDHSIGELIGESEADQVIEEANHEESQRVIAKQQKQEHEISEAAGEDGLGGFYADHDKVLRSTLNDYQTESLISGAEAYTANHNESRLKQLLYEKELTECSGDDYLNGHATNAESDTALKSALSDIQVDVMMKNVEKSHSQEQLDNAPLFGESEGDTAAKRLLEEQVFEAQHMNRHGPPSSSMLVQVESSVEAEVESEAQAGAGAQAQAMIQLRAEATAQAKAATEALAALGVEQKSQIKSQDQNLIDALKRTIGQLEAKQNPAVAAAVAKKKAVNNIQKALTNKILTRLDDSQPLINVFSKMQSLSKMMPQIQDFERRLGILHQVEPILENAISTLSKVVDLGAPLPSMPTVAPPPPPPPPPPKPAAPDLNQLKALLAQAQGQQAPAPPPAPESDDLSALLGAAGGDSAIGNLLGGSTGGGLGGLESLLGGAAAAPDPTPQLEAPAFLQAAAVAPAAPAADPLAALGGLTAGLTGSDESALLSKLLGTKL